MHTSIFQKIALLQCIAQLYTYAMWYYVIIIDVRLCCFI